MKLNNKAYIKGEIKFDLSNYDYIDLTLVDAILLTNLDNLLALPFLVIDNEGSPRIIWSPSLALKSIYIIVPHPLFSALSISSSRRE